MKKHVHRLYAARANLALWLVIIVGAMGGTVSMAYAVANQDEQQGLTDNGNITSCSVGHVADVLREMGEVIITPEQLEAHPDLAVALKDLEDALALVDPTKACDDLTDDN